MILWGGFYRIFGGSRTHFEARLHDVWGEVALGVDRSRMWLWAGRPRSLREAHGVWGKVAWGCGHHAFTKGRGRTRSGSGADAGEDARAPLGVASQGLWIDVTRTLGWARLGW